MSTYIELKSKLGSLTGMDRNANLFGKKNMENPDTRGWFSGLRDWSREGVRNESCMRLEQKLELLR